MSLNLLVSSLYQVTHFWNLRVLQQWWMCESLPVVFLRQFRRRESDPTTLMICKKVPSKFGHWHGQGLSAVALYCGWRVGCWRPITSRIGLWLGARGTLRHLIHCHAWMKPSPTLHPSILRSVASASFNSDLQSYAEWCRCMMSQYYLDRVGCPKLPRTSPGPNIRTGQACPQPPRNSIVLWWCNSTPHQRPTILWVSWSSASPSAFSAYYKGTIVVVTPCSAMHYESWGSYFNGICDATFCNPRSATYSALRLSRTILINSLSPSKSWVSWYIHHGWSAGIASYWPAPAA